MEIIAPTEVLVPGGAVYRYGGSQAPGATIFVDNVSDLLSVGEIDFAIVDAPCSRMEEVLKIAKFAVFVACDPSDRSLAALAGKLPTFGWCSTDVVALSEYDRMLQDGPVFPTLAARLSNLAHGVRVKSKPVVADAFASCGAEVWRTLPEVMAAVLQTSAGRDLLKLVFGRYYQVMNLVVPTDEFRRYYGSIDGLLRAVDSAARMVRGQAGEFYIPYLSELLRELAASLGSRAPKVDQFTSLVRDLIAESGVDGVRVAAHNVTAATMTEQWLRSSGIAPDVEVVSLSALGRLPPTEHLLLTGMPPAWARHVLSSGVARNIHVMAYARASTGPPAEADQVFRAIASATTYAEWMARSEARQICWGLLTADPAGIVDPAPAPPIIDSSPIDLPEENGGVSLWGGLLETGALGQRYYNGAVPHEIVETAAVANANAITFADGRWLLLATDSWVTRLRGGKAEEGIEASKLREGDVLVVIDRDPRKALLDKLVEQAAFIPEYAAVSEFVRIWRETMRGGYARFGTYSALNSALKGVDVTDVTIGTWVRGSVIGPSDRENVRRVGEALGSDVLVRNHGLICGAITTLRGIHVKLGRRIGDMAMQDGIAGAIGTRGIDEIVDEHSGLTVGDFKRCVEFLKIKSIQTFGEVPAEMLGIMRLVVERDVEGEHAR
ncbi:MAG: DrmE family protein [Vulcanimicrobiaceae bacterium]